MGTKYSVVRFHSLRCIFSVKRNVEGPLVAASPHGLNTSHPATVRSAQQGSSTATTKSGPESPRLPTFGKISTGSRLPPLGHPGAPQTATPVQVRSTRKFRKNFRDRFEFGPGSSGHNSLTALAMRKEKAMKSSPFSIFKKNAFRYRFGFRMQGKPHGKIP